MQGAADDSGSQPIVTVDGEGATGIELDEVFVMQQTLHENTRAGKQR